MNLGICLNGVEAQFESALRARAKKGQPFVYLEIGTANCDTWLAVCQVLSKTGAQWRTIGIDPWVHAYESYQKKIAPLFDPPLALMLVRTREEAFRDEKTRIGKRLDFVFIDGCHSEKCATEDFLSVEPLVQPGGLVVAHDFWDGPCGIQPHCQQELGVIPAFKKLRLFDNSRPGWRRLPDWTVDMKTNNYPCGCFERI